jgi:hypothetical protein
MRSNEAYPRIFEKLRKFALDELYSMNLSEVDAIEEIWVRETSNRRPLRGPCVRFQSNDSELTPRRNFSLQITISKYLLAIESSSVHEEDLNGPFALL